MVSFHFYLRLIKLIEIMNYKLYQVQRNKQLIARLFFFFPPPAKFLEYFLCSHFRLATKFGIQTNYAMINIFGLHTHPCKNQSFHHKIDAYVR